jgi:hypothetical protein
MLEHEQTRRASLARALTDEPDTQNVYILGPEGHLLAQTLCASAYALASAGTLHPLDRGGSFAGDEILALTAERLTHSRADLFGGMTPFRDWE